MKAVTPTANPHRRSFLLKVIADARWRRQDLKREREKREKEECPFKLLPERNGAVH